MSILKSVRDIRSGSQKVNQEVSKNSIRKSVRKSFRKSVRKSTRKSDRKSVRKSDRRLLFGVRVTMCLELRLTHFRFDFCESSSVLMM